MAARRKLKRRTQASALDLRNLAQQIPQARLAYYITSTCVEDPRELLPGMAAELRLGGFDSHHELLHDMAERAGSAMAADGVVPQSRERDAQHIALAMLQSAELQGSVGLPILATRATWFAEGLAELEVGDTLASSLMATDVSPEVLADFQLPYPCTRVRLSGDMLRTADGVVRSVMLTQIMVPMSALHGAEYRPIWLCLAEMDGGLALHYVAPTIEEIASGTERGDRGDAAFTLQMTDVDDRVMLLARRLIVSTCLWLTTLAPSETPEPVNAAVHQRYDRDRRGWMLDPQKRMFRVLPPRRLKLDDVREQVRDYVAGDRSKLTSQHVVRGHYKLQAHGKGRLERKKIWVAPYPRGPRDAPITVRATKLPDMKPNPQHDYDAARDYTVFRPRVEEPDDICDGDLWAIMDTGVLLSERAMDRIERAGFAAPETVEEPQADDDAVEESEEFFDDYDAWDCAIAAGYTLIKVPNRDLVGFERLPPGSDDFYAMAVIGTPGRPRGRGRPADVIDIFTGRRL